MLSKATDAVQVSNILLSGVECSSYELCKILCSLSILSQSSKVVYVS